MHLHTDSADGARYKDGNADKNEAASTFRESSEQPTSEPSVGTEVRSLVQTFDIEEGSSPSLAASTLPQTTLGNTSRIGFNVPRAMLGSAARAGISTVAGRSASWALQKCLPEHLGVAAYGVSAIGTTIRGIAALNLCQQAAQTVESRPLRGLAITGAVLGAGTMMLPAAMLIHSPDDRLANTVAMQSIADFTYAAVRDPMQSVLRDVGPRISLPPPGNWNHPDLRALAFAGGVYALSALGWLSLFDDYVSPTGCGDGPSCSAHLAILPAFAVEASEAMAMEFMSSLVRRAVFRENVSPHLPQPGATYINSSMRIFATGIMRLLDIWRQQPGGPSGIVYAFALALMMFSLEMLSGMTQRVITRSSASQAEQSDDDDGYDDSPQISIVDVE